MAKDEVIFLIIIILNTILVILYWVWFRLFRKKTEAGFTSRCIVMLVCPVVGPAYFAAGWVVLNLFFHKPVDLVDVIFSKDREETVYKANEEGEANIVPIEDAVSVTDTKNARALMLEVLKHDVRRTLVSISAALNSSDSEISHYAASVLQSELGKFRVSVQKILEVINKTEDELRKVEDYDGELRTPDGVVFAKAIAAKEMVSDNIDVEGEQHTAAGIDPNKEHFMYADLSPKLELSDDYNKHNDEAYAQSRRAMYGEEVVTATLGEKLLEQMHLCHQLIDDICLVLDQNVLSDMEAEQYVELLNTVGRLILKRDVPMPAEMSMLAMNNLKVRKYEACREWCDELTQFYPDQLEAYSCRMKLFFTLGDKDSFFRVMEEVKQTTITLDHDTIEMIRVFM